ncbi:MAG: UDP-N-acetylmuramate dehydrogenase [Lewinella sp.]|uniref:UDP-N-acetylmuramate dehydrogenase n=1 Tax=Lewinella sp. TaxID=2004506 RepID=UPI003D6C1B7D
MQANYNLKSLNTFGIAAIAAQYVAIHHPDELSPFLPQFQANAPCLILGGGSNLLLPDYFPGMVLHNCIKFIEVTEEKGNEVIVRAGGGVNWHEFVLWTLQQGYGGLENMALIPGTVGAAPVQNIGAYGRELKDVFLSLEALELSAGKTRTFSNQDCQFGYRDSFFKQPENRNRFLITSVSFVLTKQKHQLYTHYGAIQEQLEHKQIKHPSPQDVAAAVIEIRRSKLPDWRIYGNAGSFFKNPVISEVHFKQLQTQFPGIPSYPAGASQVKVPAGWLIDQCGWKGQRQGAVGCYKYQALVIVNHGGATAAEILAFSALIMKDVQEKYGIELEREVNAISTTLTP